MNQLITIDNVRGYIEDERVYLNAEDVARGFGFTTVATSGNECVRWNRVNEYLKGFGFITQDGCNITKDDFIPENMVYRLGFKANNEVAQVFQSKLADEILPSIRKNGMYATDDVINNILNNPDWGIRLLTKLKDERKLRAEAETKNAILMHINKTFTMTEIAKELNLKSATQLNQLLSDKKIQYKVNGTWVLYGKYSNCGYEEIKQEILDSGKTVYHRKITQLGREFILKTMGYKGEIDNEF